MKGITKKFPLLALIGLMLITIAIPLFANVKAYAAAITGQWIDTNTIIIGSATGKHATYTLDSSSGDYIYSPPVPGSFIPLPPTNVTPPPPANTCPNTISIIQVTVPADSQGTIVENHWVKVSGGRHPREKCEPINNDKPQPITLTDTAKATVPPGGAGPTTPPALGCDLGISLSVGGVLNALNPLNWLLCGIIKGMDLIVTGIDDQISNMLSIGTNGSSDDPNRIFADSSGRCGTTGRAASACNDYQTAWASFKNIALGLLVIVGLIIVISQSLGMEILDAYTIRKMLPRVLVASIAITLSWQLMRFFVTLSNDLGYGVGSLLDTPFRSLGHSIHTGGANNLLVGFAAALGGAFFDFFGMLAFVGTAALAVFITFMVLILRQIAIIVLIIFAPIAIIAYVLPNTQRVYKFWWESFSKMLLMFPLIVAFITAGHIFSAISASEGTDFVHQTIAFIAYFAPYFVIPLTFRFSGAMMSTMGNYVNSRGEGARGALKSFRGNRVKKNAQALREGRRLPGENLKNVGIGKYNYGNFAERFNLATRGAANLKNAGYNPNRWRERMSTGASTRTNNEALEALEKNQNVTALKTDDDLVETALMYDTDDERYAELRKRGLTHERAQQGTAAIRAAQRSMSAPAFAKTMLIASMGTSSGWTPRYQKGADGSDAWFDQNGNNVAEGTAGAVRRLRTTDDLKYQGAGGWRELINDKLGNDRAGAIAVLGAGRQQAESKGRYDLVGGSFTEDAAMVERNHHLAQSGMQMSAEEMTMQVHRNALKGQSRAKLMNGHNRSLEALAPVMGEQINGALSRGEAKDVIGEYAFMANSLDYASSSAPEMAEHIKTNVLDKSVDIGSLRPEIKAAMGNIIKQTAVDPNTGRTVYTADDRASMTNGEIMEALRGNETFIKYRREYSRGTDAENAGRSRPEGI